MKRIAILTSGGDSPGMNACIRALVRTGIYNKLEVFGIMHGYEGMIEGHFLRLEAQSVSGIINRGGTILKTARSKRFMTEEGMKTAHEQLIKNKIDGVCAIGGDGTFKGANEFSKKYQVPIVGIPGTIDNDLVGTDFAIGYDTAINTVVNAVDKIRDTAESHDRLFFVEVMGRDAGLIALRSGIGSGAEAILIPESKNDHNTLIEKLSTSWSRKKSSKIIIVAEGEPGGVYKIAREVKKKFDNYETRVIVLGHIQRGGSPTCMDRVLASRMGFSAVEALINGRKDVMIGIVKDEVCHTPFKDAIKHIEEINPQMLKMMEVLSS